MTIWAGALQLMRGHVLPRVPRAAVDVQFPTACGLSRIDARRSSPTGIDPLK